MNLGKMVKTPSNQVFGIILLVGVVVLAVILMKYNQTKSFSPEKMMNRLNPAPYDVSSNVPSSGIASASTLTNNQFLEVSGLNSPTPPSSCQQNLSPSDLLPKDTNSEWSNLNPASMDLKNLNLLSADQMIGINTVNSSLRNANLQIRSEPIIKKVDVGPWAHSTIEPDTYRRSLEIGCKD
jgi:hypothetical protein